MFHLERENLGLLPQRSLEPLGQDAEDVPDPEDPEDGLLEADDPGLLEELLGLIHGQADDQVRDDDAH